MEEKIYASTDYRMGNTVLILHLYNTCKMSQNNLVVHTIE